MPSTGQVKSFPLLKGKGGNLTKVIVPKHTEEIYDITSGAGIEKPEDVMFFNAGTTTVPPSFGFNGTGVNGAFRGYLEKHGSELKGLVEAQTTSYYNTKLRTAEVATGHVIGIDLSEFGAKFDVKKRIKLIGYTASPSLTKGKLDPMIKFGRKFRASIEAMNDAREADGLPRITRIMIPPFSCGEYSGKNSWGNVSAAFWKGFCAQEQQAGYEALDEIYCTNDTWVNSLASIKQSEIDIEKKKASAPIPKAKVGGIVRGEKFKAPAIPRPSSLAPSAPPVHRPSVAAPSSATLPSRSAGPLPGKPENFYSYAYFDREMEAVFEAYVHKKYGYLSLGIAPSGGANAGKHVDSIFIANRPGVSIKSSTLDDLIKNEKGEPHLVLKLAAVAYDQASTINSVFPDGVLEESPKMQLRELIRKFPNTPGDVLIPFKLAGWHWNSCKVSWKYSPDGVVTIESEAYDPHGYAVLPPKMEEEIKAAFDQSLFPGKEIRYQFNETKGRNVQTGVACGLYSNRMLMAMITGDKGEGFDEGNKQTGIELHHEVFDKGGVKKSHNQLMDEDYEMVMRYHPDQKAKETFCVPTREIAGAILSGAREGVNLTAASSRQKLLEEMADSLIRSLPESRVREIKDIFAEYGDKNNLIPSKEIGRPGKERHSALERIGAIQSRVVVASSVLNSIFMERDSSGNVILKIHTDEFDKFVTMLQEKMLLPASIMAPPRPPVSQPASLPVSSVAPPPRPPVSQPASVFGRVAGSMRAVPVVEPIKDRYERYVAKLKVLASSPAPSPAPGDVDEIVKLKTEMDKNFLVVGTSEPGVEAKQGASVVSFEVRTVRSRDKNIRTEDGKQTLNQNTEVVKGKVDIEVGEYCALSKDEKGRDVVVLDHDRARQDVMDWYKGRTRKIPPTAVRVLMAEQVVEKPGLARGC